MARGVTVGLSPNPSQSSVTIQLYRAAVTISWSAVLPFAASRNRRDLLA
jgi:hypothetical protein